MNSSHLLKIAALLISMCIGVAHAGIGSSFFILNDIDGDATPSEARNLRAKTRYHWQKATQAENRMFVAENDDDVEGYEKYLQIMREEDPKWMALAAEYDQIRDILESKIRTGELTIEGFTPRYEKGTFSSIVDHLTGKARN